MSRLPEVYKEKRQMRTLPKDWSDKTKIRFLSIMLIWVAFLYLRSDWETMNWKERELKLKKEIQILKSGGTLENMKVKGGVTVFTL